METHPIGLKSKGYQQLTVAATAVALTVPAGSVRAVIGVEDQPLRYTVDGTTPTSSLGFNAKADVVFELNGNTVLKAFKAIRTGGTSAVLSIHYYG